MTVTWLASAVADVVRLVRHIADENPLAARRVALELIVAGDSLSTFPRRGRVGLTRDTRELVAIPPYVLVYEVAGSDVIIIRVWHAAQDRR